MSVIVEMHCWDVLVTAADACCIQLLRDTSDSVCIAVGHTLNSFCDLEQMLMSLMMSVVTCHATNNMSQLQTAALQSQSPAAANIVPSAAVSIAVSSECVSELSSVLHTCGRCEDDLTATVTKPLHSDQQLKMSSHISQVVDIDLTCSQQVCTNSNESSTEPVCHRFTRSGRQVKSAQFADFLSSDTVVKKPSRSGVSVCKTSLKHHQDRIPLTTSCADSTDNLDVVEVKDSNINQCNAAEASCSQQTQLVNETCEQQSQTDTGTYDGAADVTVGNGTLLCLWKIRFFYSFFMSLQGLCAEVSFCIGKVPDYTKAVSNSSGYEVR